MAELIDLDDARALVLERCSPRPAETVELADALGRVVAAPVFCPDPVPAADNSAMDGYAVRSRETAGASAQVPARLRLVAESRAGHPALRTLDAGEAIAISTGAVIPDGADAIVRVEDTERDGEAVLVRTPVETGRDIRRAGDDVAAGEQILRPGMLVGPAELGVLASAGCAKLACWRRPTVRVLVTGDELIRVDDPMRPGAVRDSNAWSTPALARMSGAMIEQVGHARDDPGAVRSAIEDALAADVTIICGGLSVGEHDHVRPALRNAGVEQVFWGVALRPGKPTYFGIHDNGLVLGLPGNPVSAMVTFTLFAFPALLALQGRDPASKRVTARMASSYDKQPGRADAARCSLSTDSRGWVAQTAPDQRSHVLTSMLGADGLVVFPRHSTGAGAGDEVQVELMPWRT